MDKKFQRFTNLNITTEGKIRLVLSDINVPINQCLLSF